MPSMRTGRDSRRRGATRRHARRRWDWSRVDWTGFDRWLDRLVVVALSVALLVGGIALLLTLLI
ncbi:hypothetical protein RSO68_14220 [Halomonas saccharevitans]|uniref:Uncharacterized protein n=1 Tax=Halomonas saccharevitans TaxID=416872 RepID=A0A1I7BYB1_9GAMM|nr:hypothetical protein [Halomonas saccharevitans]MDT8880628.1 hypothetical protein [Halomonas saccharevitans]SFT92186.1 hypothetical protein SAMN04487956_13216 [Halomonas saccharevitans]